MENKNKNIQSIIDDTEENDFKIIFKLLEIDKIESAENFNSIINLLTNHSNPIREAAALKLEDFIVDFENYFISDFSVNKIIDAISDINPNVSRAICNLISYSKKLKEVLEEKIIKKINDLIFELKEYEKESKNNYLSPKNNTKNHAKNKKLFSMYWYLEGLSYCVSGNYNEKIIDILNYTFNFEDYTIREKSAKLLTKLKNIPDELLKKANSDQNFYVKIQVYGKINNDEQINRNII